MTIQGYRDNCLNMTLHPKDRQELRKWYEGYSAGKKVMPSLAKVSKERSLNMLKRYIEAAHDGKMIGEWNDGGRLLN